MFSLGLFLNCGVVFDGQFVVTRIIVCPSFLFWLEMKLMLCPCFDHMCLFQALLNPCFVCLSKHIATILHREKLYSLNFVSTNTRRSLSISFWEGNELITMSVARCCRDVPAVEINVFLSSQLLSAVSTEPRIICCGGSSLEFT